MTRCVMDERCVGGMYIQCIYYRPLSPSSHPSLILYSYINATIYSSTNNQQMINIINRQQWRNSNE